jgi:hypothetical protein
MWGNHPHPVRAKKSGHMPVTSTCAVCCEPFRHCKSQVRITCSLKCRSAHVSASFHRRKYRPAPQALTAKRAANRRRVEEATGAQFGVMSEREHRIFREGVKVGYRQGYHRAGVWFRQTEAA